MRLSAFLAVILLVVSTQQTRAQGFRLSNAPFERAGEEAIGDLLVPELIALQVYFLFTVNVLTGPGPSADSFPSFVRRDL